MQCNIDSRGRAVRLTAGALLEGAGLLLAVLWFVGILGGWALSVGIALLLPGWFLIFEGIAGWCVLRAMGFRTSV